MSYQYGYVNRAIVPLAIEAGIAQTIISLIGYGADVRLLLRKVQESLEVDNPALAEALNPAVFEAIMGYLINAGLLPGVLPDGSIPTLLDVDGPEATFASRSGDTVFVTWTNPPEGFVSQIYIDGVFAKESMVTDAVDQTADDSVEMPGLSAGSHTVRVLYVRGINGDMTRFGPIVTI